MPDPILDALEEAISVLRRVAPYSPLIDKATQEAVYQAVRKGEEVLREHKEDADVGNFAEILLRLYKEPVETRPIEGGLLPWCSTCDKMVRDDAPCWISSCPHRLIGK